MKPRASRAASMGRDLGRIAEHVVARHNALAWPSPKWAHDPVGFMRAFLAFDPWDRQIEIAELVRDNPLVAIATGHRIGKTQLEGALAVWFYCCFRDARVILLGPTTDQIDAAAYRSTRQILLQSGRCVQCARENPDGPKPCPHSALITAEIHSSSHHGIRSTNDLREIRGVNVRSPEAAQGIAGENILIIADEASGDYLDKIMGAMTGNRAGGARFLLLGNPIRAEGEFFEAFNLKKDFYVTRRISSEETPNVKEDRVVIPGLATRGWVAEQEAIYGRDSPFFKMRILGEHVFASEGQIFPYAMLEESSQRWKALRHPDTGNHLATPSGPLVISCDPAESAMGDDAVFMVRRGHDVLELYPRRGINADGHVLEVMGIANRYRHPGEMVTFVLDAEGDVGARVKGAFIAYIEARRHDRVNEWLAMRYIRTSKKAERDPDRYLMVRDELAAACRDWFEGGGCIPDDAKLKIELSRFAWLPHVSGRAKCTSKDGPGGLRSQLGRSPGRADVLMLSTWVRPDVPLPIERAPSPATTPQQALAQLQQPQPGNRAAAWDPYAALRQFYNPR